MSDAPQPTSHEDGEEPGAALIVRLRARVLRLEAALYALRRLADASGTAGVTRTAINNVVLDVLYPQEEPRDA